MAEQKQPDAPDAHAPDTWIRTPVSDSSDYLDADPIVSGDDLDDAEREKAEKTIAAHSAGKDDARGLSLADYDLESAPYTGSFRGDFYGEDDTGEKEPQGGTAAPPDTQKPPPEGEPPPEKPAPEEPAPKDAPPPDKPKP